MRPRRRLIVPWLLPACSADIIRPQSINHPQLNATALGQLALVGSFDSMSTFNYVGENSVLAPVVENDNLVSQAVDAWEYYLSASFADGAISESCLLDSGVAILAGNFTNIRGTDAAGIVRLDLESGSVETLGNITLTGAVQALWCNHTDVYVGGNLQLGNSQGVGIWNDTSKSWALPQFGGFPLGSQVSAITPLDNDTVLFGGHLGAPLFGSSSHSNGTQQLGLGAATVQATDGTTDASNVLCMSGSPFEANSGSQTSVLNIDLARTITLSQIAIANPPSGSDGTQNFRIVSSPSESIMNLTYSQDGEIKHCDAYCPLGLGETAIFSFVNPVGSRNLTISLLSYYGDHAAIQGIELYSMQSFVYANNELNAPLSCQNISLNNNAQLQGDWQREDDGESADITTGEALLSTWIRYYPNVTTTGNFSLNLWTPGCAARDTCDRRGEVNVTVYPGPLDQYEPISLQIFQTNNELKYDPVYNGTLVRTSDFDPYVEVQPVAGQQTPLEFVAAQLEVTFVTAGPEVLIDKLFEFSVSNYTQFSDSSAFRPVGDTALNRLGTQLGTDASIDSIATFDNAVYIGGNLTNSSLISLNVEDNSVETLSDSGRVYKLYTYGDTLLAVQDYNSVHNVTDNYKNVYNHPVNNLALFNLNGTSMLAYSLAGSNSTLDLYNFTSNDWYDGDSAITGHISQTLVYNSSNFYFGSFRVAGAQASGAASVDSNYQVNSLPFSFVGQNSSSLTKRDGTGADSTQQVINAGCFWNKANILGGHFTANTSDGNLAENLMVVNGSDSYGLETEGLDAGSTISSLAVYGNSLIIAGDLQGSHPNMAVYDLSTRKFANDQPSGISGNIQQVVPRVDTFIVMGNFTVGECSQFCIYNVTSNSWSTPSRPSAGTLYGSTLWSGDALVMYGENIEVGGTQYNLVQYGFNQQQYTPYTNTGIDGNITSINVGVNDQNNKFLAVSWTNGTGHNIQWFDGRSWSSSTSPLNMDSSVSSISTLPVVSSSNNSSIPLGSGSVLAVNGALNLPGYGNATVASFDGSSWAPLFVAGQGTGRGSIASFYSEKQISLGDPSPPAAPDQPQVRKLMSKGRIVGISFAIAIGCISLLVIIGLIWGYFAQRNQTYHRAPQRVDEKDMARAVPPEMIMAM